MHEVYAHEHPQAEGLSSIFLAGPSPRNAEDYNWRPEALEHLRKKNFSGVVYIPLTRDGIWLPNYNAQAEWEWKYLERTDVIAFWIPRDLESLPGFTTNVEFGLYVKSGKVVLGFPEGAPKIRYMQLLAEANGVRVCHTLADTLDAAIALLSKR